MMESQTRYQIETALLQAGEKCARLPFKADFWVKEETVTTVYVYVLMEDLDFDKEAVLFQEGIDDLPTDIDGVYFDVRVVHDKDDIPDGAEQDCC